ncbi:MAG: hypothetical protein COW85_03105 [Ignavibacteria bacterium CG22_combo_CG10-13_8_21_14_all_37_15]|nr:hypothetical protein [Ignavibacteria bacterium]PIP78752.1 MAG: hypothetical protein COW85_03105 [Ignavibacteria bacterium CG22_combo_CG10-13_8_21_14_all_37_15]PIS44086.1 MAG: hypothetical protein COT22_12420 [Ignavibacteria bacterium CG08_land_8_20_14_0_20_37_9]PIX95241.1 MAG: hypothetical protein COZ25_01470 [Ignavibacteria bacterium CG_4_10_14_3_um_filter_37_18]PJC61022.1 MAG: hypothetical protein CO025_01220 [Ignavibacteria bacterium CG_4_9_14_0_2_um_filter_37_13]
MKKFSLLLLSLVFFQNGFSQETDSLNVASLKKIYNSLEYNTIAFNDLKEQWIINDPVFIREIFNRFVVRNAFRINDKKVSREYVEKTTEDIYSGNILIEVRQRYYDDEIEFFAFIPEGEINQPNPKYSFDPVIDGFYLREVLNEKIYEKVRVRDYYYDNLTKTEYDVKTGYYFNLYLDLLEPEVMYWNTTSNSRNKYLLSFFGKWGDDHIMQPGWYANEYIVGSKMTYYSNISNNPQNYTYSVSLGTNMPASKPFIGTPPAKPLYVSGKSLYVKISGDVMKYIDESLTDFDLSIESKYTFVDNLKTLDYGKKSAKFDFYSNKTYFVLELKKRNLFDLFDFGQFELGGGIGSPDIHHLQYDPAAAKITDLDGKKTLFDKFTHFAFIDFGVSRTGGLIQHNLNTLIGYNVQDGFGYFGVKMKVMLSDTFGMDIRYFNTYGVDKKKYAPWRYDSFLVFSPILKINY